MRKRDTSIHSRLKALTLLQVFICVAFFAFMSVSKVMEAFHTYQQNTVQAAALFSSEVFSLLNNAVDISRAPGLISNTATPQSHIATALQKGNLQDNLDFGHQFYVDCKSKMEQYPALETVAVYEPDGSAVYVNRSRDTYYANKCAQDAPWLTAAVEERGAATVIAPADIAGSGLGVLYDQCVVITRAVFNPYKMKSVGVYVMAISTDALEGAFQTVKVESDQQYALYYDKAPLIAAFDAGTFETAFAKLVKRQSATHIANDGGKAYLEIYYRYDSGNALAIRTPLDSVISAVLDISLLLLIVLSAILTLFIILINRLFRSILRPLDRLTSAFDHTTDTVFPTLSSDQLPADLLPVFTSYNRMSERIDLLINEGLRKDIAQRDTELQLLRTQINPHYLYNTLECIHMRAYTNQDYPVARMAELLGSNLQYGLKATTRKVSLRAELKKARDYMTLVSFHYGDQVRLTTHVDEHILDCIVIKLLLQPLIENAIQHGLKANETLTIELLGYRAEDQMILQVTDDGAGMETAKLERLKQSLKNYDTGNSIGLGNVNRRLQLNYGEQYGVKINSVRGQGTVVTLNLPLEWPNEK